MLDVCRWPARIDKRCSVGRPAALIQTAQRSGLKNQRLFDDKTWGSWYRHPFLFFPPTNLVSTLPECVDSPTLVYEFVQPYEIGQCGQVQHAEINR